MNVGQANVKDRKNYGDREAPPSQPTNYVSHYLIQFVHKHLRTGRPTDMLGSHQTLPCGRLGNQVQLTCSRENDLCGTFLPA
jgi:hypothetical protein